MARIYLKTVTVTKIKEPNVYLIQSIKSGQNCGIIRWADISKEWIFEPSSSLATVWTEDALEDILMIIDQLKSYV